MQLVVVISLFDKLIFAIEQFIVEIGISAVDKNAYETTKMIITTIIVAIK
jgi:hypothetical protein